MQKSKFYYHTEDGRIYLINRDGKFIAKVPHHLHNEYSHLIKNDDVTQPPSSPIQPGKQKSAIHDFLKKLPNSNWKDWVGRHHKENPESLTDEVKGHLEHFSGMAHIPKIGGMRFDKTHSLESAIGMLKEAEKSYIEKTKKDKNLVGKPKTAKKILDLGNGKAWWSLGKPACEAEGKAMGHCGNVPSQQEHHDVLSLRTEHVLGGKKFYEPHLTFINDKRHNFLGEMKGRANQKPAKHYHNDIVALLKKGYVPFGGGYLPENNFHPNDLGLDHFHSLAQENPMALLAHDDFFSDSFTKRYPEAINSIVNHPNMELRNNVASNPNTPSHILEKLSGDEDGLVRNNVARHPNTPSHILEKLGGGEDGWVTSSVANHPNTPSHILEKLSGNEYWGIRNNVAGNPNAPVHVLEKLGGDEDWRVRENIAKHPNTLSHILEKLSEDESWGIRNNVAKHPNTPSHILEKLGEDGHWAVRKNVAKHPNTPVHILEKLNEDDESDVRNNIATNPNTPSHILQKLSGDKHWGIRNNVAEHLHTPVHVLEKLSGDEDRRVRNNVAIHPNTPVHVLEKLSGDESWLARNNVAINPNTPVDILEKLSGDEDSDVKSSAINALANRQQKLAASEKDEMNLIKGQRGDWEKEGYTFKIHEAKQIPYNAAHNVSEHRITAHDVDGNRVGEYVFRTFPENHKHTDKLFVGSSNTDSDHRRRGLASKAYQIAENHTGKTILSHGDGIIRSKDAKALWSQKDRPFGKSELKKGSFQSRNKYNPDSMSREEAEAIHTWQKDAGSRESIPKMDENAKKRALNKISKLTQVRRDPETGKRLFLLHRGMSQDEKGNAIDGIQHIEHGYKSWTPRKSIADGFAGRYLDGSPDRKSVSAWIHEDDIHSYLPQAGDVGDKANFSTGKIRYPNALLGEHEVIVDHTRPSLLATNNLSKDPNTKINKRFEQRVDKSKVRGSNLQAGMSTDRIWQEEKANPRMGKKSKIGKNPYGWKAEDTVSESLDAPGNNVSSIIKHLSSFNVPKESLDKLSNHETTTVRGLVANHPSSTPELLHKLSDDEIDLVRSNVAKNLKTSIDTLKKLSKDPSDWVRNNVASNPNTSIEMLHELANDEQENVRQVANKNLQSRQGKLAASEKDEMNLIKGQRGDWEKEGYTFKHFVRNSENTENHRKDMDAHEIHAFDSNGNLAGKYSFHHYKDGGVNSFTGKQRPPKLEIWHAKTEEPHKRKGLASKAYSLVEEKVGLPVQVGISQSKDAKALWSQKDRPFGKSESGLTKIPHIIFSTQKPRFVKNLNYGNEDVIKALKSRGIKAIPVKGKYGKEEHGVMVINPPSHKVQSIINFVKDLGQDSALYSDGDSHELHILNGEHSGKHFKGQGTNFYNKKPHDFYTTTDDRHFFSHNIDFDEMHGSDNSSITSKGGVSWKKGSHPHAYDWHDDDDYNLNKTDHPHTEAHGPQQNDQAGGSLKNTLGDHLSKFGTISPNAKSDLMFYKDIHHHTDKINNYIHGKGNKVYFAGGKFGAPDLKNKNYKTNHLMIYDPSEGSGGDFGQEAYTSAWRKAHEQAHHETYPEVNKIYGEGRRLGKMGVRSPNEMLRAVHWEDLAVNRQRDIMKGLGYNMSDEDFNRERNTVLTDAVTRAISGKFSDPSQEGFVPHSHHVPLEHYLDVLNEHANKLGLGRHDTFASKSKLAANELVESSLNK